ncbi:MAG: hypothetical protein KJ970_15080 [Candidatus Eisenbacteria bacterium]|uniref:Uncharacterized protein n=1 Tax=Eiseniibacteriota bacterium TaxID=2212470 RepID=A0A948W759_UNCEI|nr:hypothetical protein [Candidatus Eisenbacteria bacterium]
MRNLNIALQSCLAPMASARAIKITLAISLLFLATVITGRVLGFVSISNLAHLRALVLIPGLPIAAIILSEMALRDGISQKTLLYPLLGPVSRPALAVVRTLVTALILITGATLLILILHFLRHAGWGSFPREFYSILLGALAYTGLFSVIHLFTKRGMIISLAVYFIFDHFIGQIPFSIRSIVPSYHLRLLTNLEETFQIPISMHLESGTVLESSVYLIIMAAIGFGLTASIFSKKNLGELC